MGNNLLVGILVVAVVLISGCVEERTETTTTTLKHETRPDYCELDSDCGWVSCCNYGYKCMRKDALYCPDDMICPAYSEPKPVNPCVCVDNKCSVQPTQGVIIYTDKTEYEQGEAVNITAENGLDVSIWYFNAELCGGFNWWHLQRLEEDIWREVNVHKPVEGKCLFCVREPAPVESFVDELKPNSGITDDWSLKNCERISPSGNELRLTDIGTGVYRISFTYGLSKNNYAEKTIYSNEFTIKEREVFDCEAHEDCGYLECPMSKNIPVPACINGTCQCVCGAWLETGLPCL